jgi:hypothetical protein
MAGYTRHMNADEAETTRGSLSIRVFLAIVGLRNGCFRNFANWSSDGILKTNANFT